MRSRFVVEAILVRTVAWSRAAKVPMDLFNTVEQENLINGQRIIKRDYDKELEGEGRSLPLYYFW